MTSWRQTTSAAAQEDLDALFDTAVNAAAQELATEGEFLPFAIAIDDNSEPRMIATYAPDTDEQPSAPERQAQLLTILRNQAPSLRAAAIVSDVRVAETRTDAIEIVVEHVDGQAIRLLVPYRLVPGDSLDIDTDATVGNTAAPRIWAHP